MYLPGLDEFCFNPKEYLEDDVTHTKLVKVDKLKLWNLTEYLKLEAPEDTKKAGPVSTILVNCNPEEKERQHERMKVFIDRAKLTLDHRRQEQQAAFYVNRCFSLVPRFDPEKVELFFEMFELQKIARQREWPKEQWVILIQGSLTGKAQEAYVALDLARIDSYNEV